jgi:hypothetical protein
MEQRLESTGEPAPVALSPIVTTGGENAVNSRVGMALIKIDEERAMRNPNRHRLVNDQIVSFTQPDLRLNLHVLLAAHRAPAEWEESLRSISLVVAFFQARHFFDRQAYPALDPAIERLVVTMETVDFETQNHIWGALGAKYLPSVIYQVGVITVQEGVVESIAPPILTTQVRGLS